MMIVTTHAAHAALPVVVDAAQVAAGEVQAVAQVDDHLAEAAMAADAHPAVMDLQAGAGLQAGADPRVMASAMHARARGARPMPAAKVAGRPVSAALQETAIRRVMIAMPPPSVHHGPTAPRAMIVLHVMVTGLSNRAPQDQTLDLMVIVRFGIAQPVTGLSAAGRPEIDPTGQSLMASDPSAHAAMLSVAASAFHARVKIGLKVAVKIAPTHRVPRAAKVIARIAPSARAQRVSVRFVRVATVTGAEIVAQSAASSHAAKAITHARATANHAGTGQARHAVPAAPTVPIVRAQRAIARPRRYAIPMLQSASPR